MKHTVMYVTFTCILHCKISIPQKAIPISKICKLGFRVAELSYWTIVVGTDDQEFKSIKALLKCPANLNYSEFQTHVDAVAINATETFQESGNKHILTFDLRGVFYLLAAGLDFTPEENR